MPTTITIPQGNTLAQTIRAAYADGGGFSPGDYAVIKIRNAVKAYANSEPTSGAIVDPRFNLVKRGCAPYVEWLGQKENPTGAGWAAGAGYGAKIIAILAGIMATNAPPAAEPSAPPQQPEPTAPPADNPAAPEPTAPTFDNEPRPWEKAAVEKAVQRGIIVGDERGDLMLHSPATRADVLVFLERTGVL